MLHVSSSGHSSGHDSARVLTMLHTARAPLLQVDEPIRTSPFRWSDIGQDSDDEEDEEGPGRAGQPGGAADRDPIEFMEDLARWVAAADAAEAVGRCYSDSCMMVPQHRPLQWSGSSCCAPAVMHQHPLHLLMMYWTCSTPAITRSATAGPASVSTQYSTLAL